MTSRNCPPAPSCILESLRGLGYTLPTAVADLVDNSIAAGATKVDIHFEWLEKDSWISVSDNGSGMGDSTLESAMRLGAIDPRSRRASHDLGRFGLGLKTASFSQGRRLTVASRCVGGTVCCLRWDLDLLQSRPDQNWILLEGVHDGSGSRIAKLDGMTSGTIVLIEVLDRIVSEQFRTEDLFRLLDELQAHLAMVFHRVLTPEENGICITLNGRRVMSWDPFLTGHPGKALESMEYSLFSAPPVRAQLHVLPHRDLLSEREYKDAAGPKGWIQQQGIYVYRNRRLLVAGGWLGLGDGSRRWVRDEPHRLARIRLDIENSDDEEWKIDVRKSQATPPSRLRKQLTRLVREARAEARRAFASRGVVVRAKSSQGPRVADIWSSVRKPSGTSYRIALEHDLVASILDRSGALRTEILAMLRLLEATLPVQRIWIDTAEERETPRVGFVDAGESEIMETMQSLFQALTVFNGLTPEEARNRLSRTPPFDAYPKLLSTLTSEELKS